MQPWLSEQAAALIVGAIQQRIGKHARPFLVALDGGSGAGKSTIAALVAEALAGVVITSDDFFAAALSNAEWDARSPAQRAADAIDWRRLRAEALEPLLAGKPARWHPFDFVAGARPDGSYAMSAALSERAPAAVILLDGAYAARPELADLIDLSVLIDVAPEVRHARLAAREDPQFLAAWHARWDAAEDYYFTQVRPKEAFDLVVGLGQ